MLDKKKLKKRLYVGGLIVSIGVIGYSLYSLKPSVESGINNNKVDKVVDKTIVEKETDEGFKSYILKPDWESLKKYNVKAWIYAPGTTINYPVVQGSDNDYYLKRTMYGGYSELGAIFIDAESENPFQEYNTVIYGHSTIGTGMFTDVKLFWDKGFFDSNKYFYILTPEGSYRCEISGFYVTDYNSVVYQKPVYIEQWNGYRQKVFESATNSRNILGESDKVVTLSTCDMRYGLNSEHRLLLQGKLIPYTDDIVVE